MKTLKQLRESQTVKTQRYTFEGTLYEQLKQAKEMRAQFSAKGIVVEDLNTLILTLEEKITRCKEVLEGKRPGLWDNIHAKRKRIAAGSGERMRKPGSKGAPTKQDFIDAQENFMDGKGPGKPGDAARHGLTGKSKAELQKIRSSDSASPRKKQLAHWMLNMHHKESYTEEKQATLNNITPAFKRVHPGDIYAGTDKLAKRYKKETPGQ